MERVFLTDGEIRTADTVPPIEAQFKFVVGILPLATQCFVG